MSSKSDDIQSAIEAEVEVAGKTVCERLKLLFTPFIYYESDDDNGEWSITVVPESLRAWLLVEFWIFSFIGIIMTEGFTKNFDKTDNPIYNTFGNNNICVYFDDPPFSYFAAALFMPLLFTGALYVFADVNRVYFRMKTASQKDITPRFYSIYKGISIFITLSLIFFVQVFGTQPEQNVAVHWAPFGFFQWALFLMGLQHYIYMLKINVISKDSNKYWIGIIYLVLMGIDVFIKFFLDLINVSGGKLWVHWGEWVRTFATVIDAFFMIFITICPIFIYLVFVTHLDHVKFSFKGTKSFNQDNKQQSDVEIQ